MRKAPLMRIAVGTAAVVALLQLQPISASAYVLPVTDVTSIAPWIGQAANMAKTIADDAARLQQLNQEIAYAKQELAQYKNMAFDSPASMSSFENFVVTTQNQHPTSAGDAVAQALVSSQNQSITGAVLTGLQGEMLGAQGNRQGQIALGDIMLAQMTQNDNASKFKAAQDLQQQQDVKDAAAQRAALLDTNAPPTAGMQY